MNALNNVTKAVTKAVTKMGSKNKILFCDKMGVTKLRRITFLSLLQALTHKGFDKCDKCPIKKNSYKRW